MAWDASWLMLAFFVAWMFFKSQRPSSDCKHNPTQAHPSKAKAKNPRLLKPRSADDCSLCRGAKRTKVKLATEVPTVRPWRELKSSRGRPKQVPTEGFACANRGCEYYGIKD